jgi:hypothetical protein
MNLPAAGTTDDMRRPVKYLTIQGLLLHLEGDYATVTQPPPGSYPV